MVLLSEQLIFRAIARPARNPAGLAIVVAAGATPVEFIRFVSSVGIQLAQLPSPRNSSSAFPVKPTGINGSIVGNALRPVQLTYLDVLSAPVATVTFASLSLYLVELIHDYAIPLNLNPHLGHFSALIS